MLEYTILIPVLPFIAAVLILFSGSKTVKHNATKLAIGAMALSFLLSLGAFIQVLAYNSGHPEAHGPLLDISMRWMTVNTTDIIVGILVDNLAVLMLMVVTIVALMVQIYSLGYMEDDQRFERYYGYLSLFTFSMLGLVLSNNILQLLIFWELVGLCSYLLIGFWYEKAGPQYAQKKAFLTTKLGDLGFMLGVFLIFGVFGTFHFESIFHMLPEVIASSHFFLGMDPNMVITAIGLLVFFGAMGKSAQFPLHIWLPDAMEGPTPVSALIHAATMVAAGVFLVARMYPLVALSATAMYVIAIIGTITLFMAATIALTVYDIKGVLAYSTISQLGYMMLALGAGSITAGMFHLMTHAFFKALLFLGSGSVIHAVHTQDMRKMGGLRKSMPVTFWTFIIATLALSGIPPLAGFWSKDEILLTVSHYNPALFWFALIGAGLTALYMFRLVFMTFFGEEQTHGHESPKNMTYPMIVLAVLAVVAGFVGLPLGHSWMGGFIHFGDHHPAVDYGVMFASIGFAVAGIFVAYLTYYKERFSAERISRFFGPFYGLAKNKYYMDEIVDLFVVQGTLVFARTQSWFDRTIVDGLVNLSAKITRILSWIGAAFDRFVVDGLVNLSAWIMGLLGSILKESQTGQVQTYVGAVFAGMAAIAALLVYLVML